MSEENVEIVRRMLEAYERGGFDATREFVGEGFEMTLPAAHPEAGRPYSGADSAQAQMESWDESFEAFDVEFEELLDAGDKVVVTMRQSGRILGGAKSVIDQRFAIVFELDEHGKIARMDWFGDRKTALKAAGLSE